MADLISWVDALRVFIADLLMLPDPRLKIIHDIDFAWQTTGTFGID
jgi:hypothetical protein